MSAVIPAFNAAEFIGEAIDSVIAQTFDDLEVLVIDDGSTDGTAEIAERYGSPVRVIRTPNQRVATARNTGLEAASGELVAFLDADDVWMREKLERQLEVLTDRRRFVYTDTISFGIEAMAGMRMSGERIMPSGDILAQLVERNFVGTSSVLLDREIALRAGGFDPALQNAQDWMLWLRVARLTEAAYVPEPLVRYRVRAGSLGSDPQRRLVYARQVVEEGLAMLDVSARSKALLRRRALAGCYGYAGLLALTDGQSSLAKRYSLAALAYQPSLGQLKQFTKALLGSTWTQRILSAKARLSRARDSTDDEF